MSAMMRSLVVMLLIAAVACSAVCTGTLAFSKRILVTLSPTDRGAPSHESVCEQLHIVAAGHLGSITLCSATLGVAVIEAAARLPEAAVEDFRRVSGVVFVERDSLVTSYGARVANVHPLSVVVGGPEAEARSPPPATGSGTENASRRYRGARLCFPDGQVDTSHPALHRAHVVHFAPTQTQNVGDAGALSMLIAGVIVGDAVPGAHPALAGLAPDSEILNCAFLSLDRVGALSDALACLAWCTDLGATAALVTWGAPDRSPALSAAIASLQDMVVVAAAGDQGTSLKAAPRYPAAMSCPPPLPGSPSGSAGLSSDCATHVISVGALDTAGQLLYTSNHGAAAWGPDGAGRPGVDLLAPGESVIGPGTQHRSAAASGTAVSAAVVAGVVAALQGQGGAAAASEPSPAALRACLFATAAPAGPGTLGQRPARYGRLDAEAVMRGWGEDDCQSVEVRVVKEGLHGAVEVPVKSERPAQGEAGPAVSSLLWLVAVGGGGFLGCALTLVVLAVAKSPGRGRIQSGILPKTSRSLLMPPHAHAHVPIAHLPGLKEEPEETDHAHGHHAARPPSRLPQLISWVSFRGADKAHEARDAAAAPQRPSDGDGDDHGGPRAPAVPRITTARRRSSEFVTGASSPVANRRPRVAGVPVADLERCTGSPPPPQETAVPCAPTRRPRLARRLRRAAACRTKTPRRGRALRRMALCGAGILGPWTAYDALAGHVRGRFLLKLRLPRSGHWKRLRVWDRALATFRVQAQCAQAKH